MLFSSFQIKKYHGVLLDVPLPADIFTLIQTILHAGSGVNSESILSIIEKDC